MVTIQKRRVGSTDYYYLAHSVRSNGRVEKKEKYLGKSIPAHIDRIKADFLERIYREKWHMKLDAIKRNFSAELQELPEEIRDKRIENFMIRFTYDTNRIEGGTLSLKDIAALLLEGRTPADKPISDVKEAEAHKSVFYEMLAYKKDISLATILRWHRELFRETKPGIAGKIRDYQVYISGSDAGLPSPAEVNVLLEEFLGWYHSKKSKVHPVELAALVHYKFVAIHPFGDGNGRASRMLMNFVLHKHGFPMLDISYKNRSAYYTAIERSQSKNNERIFVPYIIRRYLRDYKKYLPKNKGS